MCDPITASVVGIVGGGLAGGAVAGTAAGVLTGAGLGLSLGGTIGAGYADKQSANAQAAAYAQSAENAKIVAEFNARQIERRAEAIRKEGEQIRIRGTQEENRIRQAGAELISTQRAAFAAGNIVIDSGTPAALQISTARQTEVDALRMRDTTVYQSEANEYERQLTMEQAAITRLQGDAESAAYLNQSEAFKKAGKNAMLSSILSGIGTGINTAVDQKWFS